MQEKKIRYKILRTRKSQKTAPQLSYHQMKTKEGKVV